MPVEASDIVQTTMDTSDWRPQAVNKRLQDLMSM
jgi:hypothetical protein